MRSAVLFSWLVTACSVGEVPSGTADAGGMTGSDAGASACIDRKTPTIAHDHGNGVTHAGEPCITSGCHLPASPGSGAPSFQFAGTLYKTGGSMPNPGATIRVKSGTMEAKAVADSAGNFYIEVGTLPAMPFPATTSVTACPTTTAMSSQLTAGPPNGGNCSVGSCHDRVMPMTLADP